MFSFGNKNSKEGIPSDKNDKNEDNKNKNDNNNVKESKELDLVFLMDCTGSMGQYIDSAKQNIQSIANRIVQQENCDVRFGLVAYRDHPPQDSTFVTKIFEFTSETSTIQNSLNQLSASGGGDGPEAVTAALFEANNLNWRPNASKIVLLIADAPPHGLGERGDGFPNGDPNGFDPLVIAREMAQKNITIYPIGCEPALSGYINARAFMVGLAEITNGHAVSLASSSLLAEVILGGAAEELELQKLAQKYEDDLKIAREELRSGRGGVVDESEVVGAVYRKLKSSNIQTVQWKCDGIIADKRSDYFSKNIGLSEAKESILKTECTSSPVEHSESFGSRRLSSGRGSSFFKTSSAAPTSALGFASVASTVTPTATKSSVEKDDITIEQVQQMLSRNKRMGKY
eukprot:gene17434-22986_t